MNTTQTTQNGPAGAAPKGKGVKELTQEIIHKAVERLFGDSPPEPTCPTCEGEDAVKAKCATCKGKGVVPFDLEAEIGHFVAIPTGQPKVSWDFGQPVPNRPELIIIGIFPERKAATPTIRVYAAPTAERDAQGKMLRYTRYTIWPLATHASPLREVLAMELWQDEVVGEYVRAYEEKYGLTETAGGSDIDLEEPPEELLQGLYNALMKISTEPGKEPTAYAELPETVRDFYGKNMIALLSAIEDAGYTIRERG
jgi:hypothetical protein